MDLIRDRKCIRRVIVWIIFEVKLYGNWAFEKIKNLEQEVTLSKLLVKIIFISNLLWSIHFSYNLVWQLQYYY